jgi:hypothetical protein
MKLADDFPLLADGDFRAVAVGHGIEQLVVVVLRRIYRRAGAASRNGFLLTLRLKVR